MPRTFAGFGLPLLAMLALLSSGKAVAGPPEGVSGKMVLLRDDVADGLRKCRRMKDRTKRVEMLGQLAETRDPRVAVVLAELAWNKGGHFHRSDDSDGAAHTAAMLLMANYFPGSPSLGNETERCWDEKGRDLRRRAKQLP